MRKIVSVVAGSVVACTLVGTLVPACSSDKSSDTADAGSSPDASPDAGYGAQIPYRNEATLATNAHALMTDAKTITSTSITFPSNTETESIKVGDVIASGKIVDTYYLAMVTSITKSGSDLTFDYTQAQITDLFSSANFSQFMPGPTSLSPQDLQGIHVLGQSGTSGSQSPGAGAKFSVAGTKLDLSQSYLKVNGGIEFQMQFSGPFYNKQISLFRLAATGTVDGKLVVDATLAAGASYTSPEAQWADVKLGQFVFFVGVIPIPILWEIDFGAQVMETATGTATFGVSASVDSAFEEGVSYVGGDLTLVDNNHFTFTNTPAQLQGVGLRYSVRAMPMNAKMYLKPFNFLGGPFVELAPFAQITATAGLPQGEEVKGTAGVQVSAGGALMIFSKSLGMVNFPVFAKSFPLFDKTYDAACAGLSDGGPVTLNGTSYCNECQLKNCVGSSNLFNLQACLHKSGVCGESMSTGPSDLDSVCNWQGLATCLCTQEAAGKLSSSKTCSDAGATADAGVAGDCYKANCGACSQSALSCSVGL